MLHISPKSLIGCSAWCMLGGQQHSLSKAHYFCLCWLFSQFLRVFHLHTWAAGMTRFKCRLLWIAKCITCPSSGNPLFLQVLELWMIGELSGTNSVANTVRTVLSLCMWDSSSSVLTTFTCASPLAHCCSFSCSEASWKWNIQMLLFECMLQADKVDHLPSHQHMRRFPAASVVLGFSARR